MPANYQPRKEFPDQKIKLVSIYDTVVLVLTFPVSAFYER